MKKIILTLLSIMLIFTAFAAIAELNNVTSEGVNGDLVFYDKSKNEIFSIEATNRLMTFPSGSGLDVESGGYFKLAGTAVTASAAELNALASTGLSAEELGFLNGATAGTQVKSKAVVADANVNIGATKVTSFYIGTSGSETQVTATGAQLNFLSGVTAGTSASSKAVVLSASGKIDTIDMTAWKINGTSVTATAANLNAVPTATGTGLEIDAMTKNVYSSASTITLGAGGAVTQAAAIQLKDADGNAIAAVQKIRVYVSDDAAGATPATSGCNGAVTVSVGATLKVQTEKLDWDLVTDANGAVTLTFDNTGGGGAYTKYVVVVLPNGKVLVSAALNVATA